MARTNFPLISVPLSGVAINYARINRDSRGYIADRVAPRRRVTSQLFRWYSSKIEEAFTVYDTQIDRLGQANEMTHGWTLTEASTKDYAIREPVAYADEREAAAQNLPFSLRQQAVQNVVDQIQLNREQRVSAIVNSTGSYLGAYVTDKSGARWSDFANSDPVADVRNARSAGLIPYNVGVTSQAVADILVRHPKVALALGGSQNSGMYYPLDAIARIMGLREILVGNTLYQTSKRGQTLTTGAIWPNNFALHYQGPTSPQDPTVALASPTSQSSPDFLTTFQWNDWVSSEKEFLPGDMGLYGGVKVLAGESVVERQIAPYAGYLFTTVV